MGGDYTRFTFDPLKAFSGVRKQQGRVSLDADFNELEEIIDRRRRAQMYDTVGQAVVPMTTPQGFEIAVSGNALTIGPGRAYVDGILAECFGDLLTLVRDKVLGGVHGSAPLAYTQQPFVYRPQTLAGGHDFPKPKGGLLNLVYLDVWQREVTVWEDDGLRDPALNGPDTATRVQTAWQVKVMHLTAADATCSVPPPGWNELIAPSTGRLTAQATGVPAPPPGPCVINPAGGYTGLENHLYRVEVQKGGTLGGADPATFKWSRDNASLAARVLSIASAAPLPTSPATPTSVITVSSTGRDAWLRFDQNDHIELLDDDVELAMRETGRGGVMAKIVTVNHAAGQIHVDADLSAFAIDSNRHPRIRRWDASTPTEPLERVFTAGTPVPLEEGISVTFNGTATDKVHAGDYWVFAARTTTGQIDPVVNAPPRGIHHHFARLALVTGGPPPVRTGDCRIFWPQPPSGGHGESCCTVVVKPGEDIQHAIDSLTGVGGCVCLKMGTHHITQPLTIAQSNLTLHAEAPWTVVERQDGGEMLIVGTGAPLVNVSVMGIHFIASSGSSTDRMIQIQHVKGGRLAECSLTVLHPHFDTEVHPALGAQANQGTTGIWMDDCRDYHIESNLIERFLQGIAGDIVDRVCVLENTLMGLTIGSDSAPVSVGVLGINFLRPVSTDIERNAISAYRQGIRLGDITFTGPAQDPRGRADVMCRVAGNIITRSGSFNPTNVNKLTFGIAAQIDRCEISGNTVLIEGFGDGGILVHCGTALIASNFIRSDAAAPPGDGPLPPLPIGVCAILAAGEMTCRVRENMFTGLQQAIVAAAVQNAAPDLDISSNTIIGSVDLIGRVVGEAEAVKELANEIPDMQKLIPLLQGAEQFGSITLLSVHGGKVTDNFIGAATCAIVSTEGRDIVMSRNRIELAVVGVLLAQSFDCQANDNTFQFGVVGVWFQAGQSGTARGNLFEFTTCAILDDLGTGMHHEANKMRLCFSGIDLAAPSDARVQGNEIEDAAAFGINANATTNQLTLSHNQVLRSGWLASVPVTTGIRVESNDGTVIVEHCHTLNIGDLPRVPASASVFKGARHGIWVKAAAHTRVHGCVISSPALQNGANGASRSLYVEILRQRDSDPPATVDIADNLVEQTANMIVEIKPQVLLQEPAPKGEVIFANNRCTALYPGGQAGSVVSLKGGTLIVTGNRVRAPTKTPALELDASANLAAVANITTKGATTPAGATPASKPGPWDDFNIKD